MALRLEGMKFGKLTAIEPVGRNSRGLLLWRCLCECGKETIKASGDLRIGDTRSCGCVRADSNRTNGLKATGKPSKHEDTPTYRTWMSMHRRCRIRESYVANGITICDRWSEYKEFHDDMGDRPEGMSIGRINNNAGYSSDNCRWETPKQQARNTRRTLHLKINGTNVGLADFCESAGVNLKNTRAKAIRRGLASATGA